MMNFESDYQKVLEKLDAIDPIDYGQSRNYINGSVTYLSPYIARGVISTKQVYEHCLRSDFKPKHIEKFIQELTWRDYWQQIWISQGDKIDSDLKNKQPSFQNDLLPKALLDASTGIIAIDSALKDFYRTGYLHNHIRMYIASLATNIAKSHWLTPAKWMYYNLLDGDWASNALSWQWVCGANSGKLYFANQENIDKFCKTNQWNSYLDVSYESLPNIPIPDELQRLAKIELKTHLPENSSIIFDAKKPTFLYTWHNLDPNWRKDEDGNRILILEPSHFEKYPISGKSVQFMLDLSKNIAGIQVFTGEFDEFFNTFLPKDIYFKEHPTSRHFKGVQDDRDWLTSVKGYYPSFFGFWKKARKELIIS